MEKRSVSPIILKGIFLITLGFLVMFYTEESIKTLGYWPGVVVLAIGLIQISFSLMARKNLNHWEWYLAGGLGTMAIGIVFIVFHAEILTVLVMAIGAWFLYQSIQEFVASNSWRKMQHPNWWYLTISAILNLAIAAFLVFKPAATAKAAVLLTGSCMIFSGIIAMVVANFLRNKYGQIHTEKNTII